MRGLSFRAIRRQGQSLIGVLVALVLLSTLVFLSMKYLTAKKQMVSHQKANSSVEELRSYFANALDCTSTLKSQSTMCDGAASIVAYGILQDGTASPLPTRFAGDFSTRTRCSLNRGDYLIDVQYRRERGGQLVADPLTKRTSDWQSLFSDQPPLICSYYKVLRIKSDPFPENYIGAFPPFGAPQAVFVDWVDKMVFSASSPLVASDLIGVSTFVHTGGVRPDGTPPPVGQYRNPTTSELNLLRDAFLNERVNVVIFGDNGGTITAGAAYLQNLTQNRILFDASIRTVSSAAPPDSVQFPFMRGVAFDFSSSAYDTPGFFSVSAPARCVGQHSGHCFAAYLPRTATAGFLYAHGNAKIGLPVILKNILEDRFIKDAP